jgi:hypothetical protein
VPAMSLRAEAATRMRWQREARRAAERVLNDETGFAELERAILDAEVKSIADALAKLEFAFACT